MNQPYTPNFGIEPQQYILRPFEVNQVLQDFQSEPPIQQTYMITGVRGAGKTVIMSEIGRSLSESGHWIVLELNPEADLLDGLMSKLYSQSSFRRFFNAAKLNLSFFGLGAEISGSVPITDKETAIAKMLTVLKGKGKKVLITIDEVVNTHNVRLFVSAFQIMIRNQLPVFLLMTGLYDNIYNLQNEKSITFLYRAPKLYLEGLSISSIIDNYKKNLPVSEEEARIMGQMTNGYAFAFQVLGYLTKAHNGFSEDLIPMYRQYLEQYVYEKIWFELSAKDQLVASAIAKAESPKIKDIQSSLGFSHNEFSPYRTRLIRKGIISGKTHGELHFTLPYFREYILDII